MESQLQTILSERSALENSLELSVRFYDLQSGETAPITEQHYRGLLTSLPQHTKLKSYQTREEVYTRQQATSARKKELSDHIIQKTIRTRLLLESYAVELLLSELQSIPTNSLQQRKASLTRERTIERYMTSVPGIELEISQVEEIQHEGRVLSRRRYEIELKTVTQAAVETTDLIEALDYVLRHLYHTEMSYSMQTYQTVCQRVNGMLSSSSDNDKVHLDALYDPRPLRYADMTIPGLSFSPIKPRTGAAWGNGSTREDTPLSQVLVSYPNISKLHHSQRPEPNTSYYAALFPKGERGILAFLSGAVWLITPTRHCLFPITSAVGESPEDDWNGTILEVISIPHSSRRFDIGATQKPYWLLITDVLYYHGDDYRDEGHRTRLAAVEELIRGGFVSFQSLVELNVANYIPWASPLQFRQVMRDLARKEVHHPALIDSYSIRGSEISYYVEGYANRVDRLPSDERVLSQHSDHCLWFNPDVIDVTARIEFGIGGIPKRLYSAGRTGTSRLEYRNDTADSVGLLPAAALNPDIIVSQHPHTPRSGKVYRLQGRSGRLEIVEEVSNQLADPPSKIEWVNDTYNHITRSNLYKEGSGLAQYQEDVLLKKALDEGAMSRKYLLNFPADFPLAPETSVRYVYIDSRSETVDEHLQLPGAHRFDDASASSHIVVHTGAAIEELLREALVQYGSGDVIAYHALEEVDDVEEYLNVVEEALGIAGTLSMLELDAGAVRELFTPYFRNGTDVNKITLPLEQQLWRVGSDLLWLRGRDSMSFRSTPVKARPSAEVLGAHQTRKFRKLPLYPLQLFSERLVEVEHKQFHLPFSADWQQLLARLLTYSTYTATGTRAIVPRRIEWNVTRVDDFRVEFQAPVKCSWFRFPTLRTAGTSSFSAFSFARKSTQLPGRLKTLTGTVHECIAMALGQGKICSLLLESYTTTQLVQGLQARDIRIMIVAGDNVLGLVKPPPAENSSWERLRHSRGKVIFVHTSDGSHFNLLCLGDAENAQCVFDDIDPFAVAAEIQLLETAKAQDAFQLAEELSFVGELSERMSEAEIQEHLCHLEEKLALAKQHAMLS